MSRLCRLKTASHGEDGKWAYNEITHLRKQVATLTAQRDMAVEALKSLSHYVAFNGDDWVSKQAKQALAAITAAHYACPACKGPWTDDQRWAAIDAGEWRPTASPKDPKCRSFWLPSWCSKFVTAGYLAAQWVRAQQGQSALQDFINAECGEPYVHFDKRIKDAVFSELEGDYAEGELWAALPGYVESVGDMDLAVFGGVDVQKGYVVAVFRQFARNGDSGLIWAGDAANFEAVEIMAAQYDAQYIIMDQRYRTREVQEWAFAHPGYIPSMGVTRRARPVHGGGNRP
jgi:hypothetical protein